MVYSTCADRETSFINVHKILFVWKKRKNFHRLTSFSDWRFLMNYLQHLKFIVSSFDGWQTFHFLLSPFFYEPHNEWKQFFFCMNNQKNKREKFITTFLAVNFLIMKWNFPLFHIFMLHTNVKWLSSFVPYHKLDISISSLRVFFEDVMPVYDMKSTRFKDFE